MPFDRASAVGRDGRWRGERGVRTGRPGVSLERERHARTEEGFPRLVRVGVSAAGQGPAGRDRLGHSVADACVARFGSTCEEEN